MATPLQKRIKTHSEADDLASDDELFAYDYQREAKISDLIEKLTEIKDKEGDLVLCLADKDSLVTLIDLSLAVTDTSRYDFFIGERQRKYLNISM